ncbi:MAG: GldG family protein [Pseudomonadota bacterium]
MNWVTGRAWPWLMAAAITALFVLVNVALQPVLASARIDFTERQLYTVSDATRATVRAVTEPIDLTLVYSRRVGQDYPRIRAHAARVREVLDGYASLSGRRLRVRELDAAPFSTAEDAALAAGLTAVPTQGTDPLYFGLIGRNSVDDERVIPFLAPERAGSLEYDLTRMIARLDDPAPPRVGLLTSLAGLRGDGVDTGYRVLAEMRRAYALQPIPDTFASLPEGLDVLVIAHARPLNAYQTWLIDQFVVAGGRLVWLVDPAAKIAGAGDLFDIDPAPTSSDLGQLGRHWQVVLAEGAVADAGNALPVQTLSPDGRREIAGQPLFIAATPAQMSRTDPVTSELQRSVNLGAPGALFIAATSPFKTEPLIATGPAPSFIPAAQAAMEMAPSEVILAYDTLDAPLTLAARLTGPVTSAFADGRPPLPLSGDPVEDELLRAEAAGAPAHRAEPSGPATIVLVADADFLDDGFYINPTGGAVIADNGTLLLNAIDAVSGIDGLLELRSRAESARPMALVDRMRGRAEAEYFEEQARLEELLLDRQRRLDDFQAQSVSLAAVGSDFEAGLTPDERAELQALRADVLDTRARLREIERGFRSEIDALETTLKAVNIWGGALLAIFTGLFIWWRQKRP